MESEPVYSTNPYLIEYRKELNRLTPITDSIILDYEIKVVVQKYWDYLKFDYREVCRHLNQIREPKKVDSNLSFSLKDLENEPDNSANWLIPSLIPLGDLIIGFGKAKAGKSLLFFYELAYACTVSGSFLNFPVRKGKVIVFETEEARATVKGRLDTRGFFEEEAREAIDNELLIIKRYFDVTTNFPELEKLLELEKPVLCVFDSLRSISVRSNVSETHSDFAKPVYELQRIMILHNCAGILIHHQNKTNNNSGVDSMSGTSALKGACFALWQLVPQADLTFHLNITPRDGEASEFLIEREYGENRSWQYKFIQELGIDSQLIENESKIINYLKISSDVTLAVLNTALGYSTTSNVLYRPLNRLLERTIVKSKVSRNNGVKIVYYSLANDMWNFNIETPNQFSFNADTVESTKEYFRDTITKCKTKVDLENTDKRFSAEFGELWLSYRAELFNNVLSEKEKHLIKSICQTPPLFSKGDMVHCGYGNQEKRTVVDLEYNLNTESWNYVLNDDAMYYSEQVLEKYGETSTNVVSESGEGSLRETDDTLNTEPSF